MGMDGAQEQTKKGAIKAKANSAQQQMKQKKKGKQATEDTQQEWASDEEDDWEAWANSAEGREWIAAKAVKQQPANRAKGGRGSKGGKGGPPAHHSQSDVPRMICRSYWVTGSCPRKVEHGFCPFSHFTRDQIVMDGEGYWRPKPGLQEAGAATQPRPPPPHKKNTL